MRNPAPFLRLAAGTCCLWASALDNLDAAEPVASAVAALQAGNSDLPPTTPPLPSIGPVRGIQLHDALILTLAKNPNIQIQEQDVAAARGALREAAGPFDPTLSAQGSITDSSLREDTTSSDTVVAGVLQSQGIGDGISRSTERDVSGQLSLSKLFRNGITLAPQATLSNDLDRSQGETDDDGSTFVGFSITVPLLQGLGPNNADATAERASRLALEASQLTLEYTVSNELYATIEAFWQCLLAQANVRVARMNENDASRLVSITRALVKGYVQPSIQIVQAEANLESYVAARITAEQEQSEAAQALAIAIGLDPTEIGRELLVVDTFPQPPAQPTLDVGTIPALVDLALRRRPDLESARLTEAAGVENVAGARNSALPQVNVQLGGGFQQGTTSISESGAGGREKGNGYAVGAGLSMDWPLLNDAAQGALEQKIAALAQARIQVAQQASQIASDVITTAKSVVNARATLEHAVQAATDQRTTVQAQEKLFSMGITSLVDVISTQTSLATAELAVVEALSTYATAVANLRFTTGTLLHGSVCKRKLIS